MREIIRNNMDLRFYHAIGDLFHGLASKSNKNLPLDRVMYIYLL